MRVVLAEDGVLLRAGVEEVLRRFGIEVVASVGDAPALLDAVAAGSPDLVLTDVRMPPGDGDDGLRAAVRLRADDPRLPVVVFSQYVAGEYAEELLSSGDGQGVGYLLKDRVVDVAEFVDVLRRVAAGGTVIDHEVVRSLLGRRRDPLARLTGREREVLALVAEGMANSAVGRRLGVTEAAVHKHVGSILLKLGLPPGVEGNRRVLAVLAYLRAS